MFVPYAEHRNEVSGGPFPFTSALQGDKHHGGLMPCPGNFFIPQFRLHLAHNHSVFNGVRLLPTDIWLLSEITAQIWQGLFQLSTKPHVLPTKGQDVQDFLGEHYFFMPLSTCCFYCTINHINPIFGFHSFEKNIESFWHCVL